MPWLKPFSILKQPEMSRSRSPTRQVRIEGLQVAIEFNGCLATTKQFKAADSDHEVKVQIWHPGCGGDPYGHTILQVHMCNIWNAKPAEEDSPQWQGHIMFMQKLSTCSQEVFPISREFGGFLAAAKQPEDFVFLRSGRTLPLPPAEQYVLKRVCVAEGVAWLLMAKPRSKKHYTSFFNGSLGIWQHTSILGRLSYGDFRPYCYVVFQPVFPISAGRNEFISS